MITQGSRPSCNWQRYQWHQAVEFKGNILLQYDTSFSTETIERLREVQGFSL